MIEQEGACISFKAKVVVHIKHYSYGSSDLTIREFGKALDAGLVEGRFVKGYSSDREPTLIFEIKEDDRT